MFEQVCGKHKKKDGTGGERIKSFGPERKIPCLLGGDSTLKKLQQCTKTKPNKTRRQARQLPTVKKNFTLEFQWRKKHSSRGVYVKHSRGQIGEKFKIQNRGGHKTAQQPPRARGSNLPGTRGPPSNRGNRGGGFEPRQHRFPINPPNTKNKKKKKTHQHKAKQKKKPRERHQS